MMIKAPERDYRAWAIDSRRWKNYRPRPDPWCGSLTDKPALLLSQGGVEVEHEGVGIHPKLGQDELGHAA